MPHADPQKLGCRDTGKISQVHSWGGSLFAACHSVSGMEAYAPTYLGFIF